MGSSLWGREIEPVVSTVRLSGSTGVRVSQPATASAITRAVLTSAIRLMVDPDLRLVAKASAKVNHRAKLNFPAGAHTGTRERGGSISALWKEADQRWVTGFLSAKGGHHT